MSCVEPFFQDFLVVLFFPAPTEASHCNTVLLQSSKNVLWTIKLHLTFHQHGGEEMMTEFNFLNELLP